MPNFLFKIKIANIGQEVSNFCGQQICQTWYMIQIFWGTLTFVLVFTFPILSSSCMRPHHIVSIHFRHATLFKEYTQMLPSSFTR